MMFRGTPSPPPESPHNKQGLSIQVPKQPAEYEQYAATGSVFTAPSQTPSPTVKLGEAMSMNKNFSPTQEDMDSITQLPTPIINNGSFGSFGSFGSPVDNQALEMVKLRRKSSLNRSVSRKEKERVISEYKPAEKRMPEKRVVSLGGQTGRQMDRDDKGLTSMPSPDCGFDQQQFYSAKYGRVFKFVKVIGRGNFSQVVLVEDGGVQVAVKIVNFPMNSKNQMKNFKSFLKRELNILFQLHHPHVIQLLDYSITLPIDTRDVECSELEEESPDESFEAHSDDKQLIFLNYCPGGNLFEFSSRMFRLHSHNLVYWLNVRQIVRELMWAVDYIHQNRIVHRDIKLENVLLNYSHEDLVSRPLDHISCLTDFGLAKKVASPDQLLATRCGSQDYIAPEILMGLKYNGFLTDSWSVGVLIYCLLEDRLPFDLPSYKYLAESGISPSVIKRKMAKNTPAHRIAMIDWDWSSVSDLMNEGLDEEIKTILCQLKSVVDVLLVRKDRRKTVAEVLQMPGFEWLNCNSM